MHTACVCVCVCVCVYTLSCFSGVQLFVTLWTIACQALLLMECSRQEYWSGLPRPSPGDLPNPGIKPVSLSSPALAGRFFTTVPPGKPWYLYIDRYICVSNSLRPHGLQHTRLPCPLLPPRVCSNSCPLSQCCQSTSYPLSPRSPPAFNLSQPQSLFQWVSSSHQVAKVLELQLQHQRIFKVDFLIALLSFLKLNE